jgi:hypothetical protein
MPQTATLLGSVPAGARVVAIGSFTSSTSVDMLIALPDGSYQLWTTIQSGLVQFKSVTIPSGYQVLGSGAYDVTIPGSVQLLLQSASGTLAYGSYQAGQASFTATVIGNPGTGWSVAAQADFNAWYHGNDQVLLQSVQNGVGTLWAYQSQLPSFTLPAGFSVAAVGAGNVASGGAANLFGSDLPATLISNAGGTVAAILQATVTPQPVSVISIIGTLQPGQTIAAVSEIGNTGTAAILLQDGSQLTEWLVHQGTLTQTQSLGTIPAGATVAAFTDVNGDLAPDVLLMTNTGTVEALMAGGAASPAISANRLLSAAANAAIAVDSGYNVVAGTGANATLSNDVLQLAAGNLAATGVTVLVIQQGVLSQCSFEQVAAGNISFATWQQNVAALNAIAQACREQGILVEVETGLGLDPGWGTAQTEQWLEPAIAAGLPIGFVEDDSEPNLQTLNFAQAAARMLQNIAIINAAYPDAVYGEWQVLGDVSTTGAQTPYLTSLQNWWMTLNGSAAAQGLPGLSYVVADQYYSPQLVSGSATAISAGKTPGDTTYNQFAAFMNVANASGIAVHPSVTTSDADLNAVQALARQELLVSQEAALGIAGVRLSSGFNALPTSAFVNVPGSTYNAAAEIAAIEPLYASARITVSGAVQLGLPSQVVLRQGTAAALGGFSIAAGAADQAGLVAVVLIDLNGALSATPIGSATVTRNGANTLILNGTPKDVNAVLATLTLSEAVAGPDSIDVEVFGAGGRIGGGTVPVVAVNQSGAGIFLPDPASGATQPWLSATADVEDGGIVSETFTWNTDNGVDASAFIGGTAIAPIVQIAVAQPLLERGLTVSGANASLDPSILTWHSTWQIYEPLRMSQNWSSEIVPVTVAASTLTFDAASGELAQQIQVLAPVTAAAIAGLFPFNTQTTPYYFADGGLAVTSYAVPNSPYWSTALYAGGAGGIVEMSGGSTMVIAAGSTTSMVVGSIQTIYGKVNGSEKVIEVRYLGGSGNPYDEIDQIFNPYSDTPQLWQQVQTVGIPNSMTGGTPLALPSATTIIEYNTGNNPNWSDTIWTQTAAGLGTVSVAGYQAVAVTVEGNNWDSQAQISATGVVTVQQGVTWLGEGQILAAYSLAAPRISGWAATAGQAGAISGFGIPGDFVAVTGSDGKSLGGTQVGGAGTWTLSLPTGTSLPASYGIVAQQFDLAGDSSAKSAVFSINNPGATVLGAFTILDTMTGVATGAAGVAYNGPVVGLDWQYIAITMDSLNITSSVPNAFIHSGPGMDGLNVSAANGNNILDGGTGSNFLTGGTGNDTFYLDGRNPVAPVWSTVVNFHAGDDVTFWGVDQTDFAMTVLDDAGASGYTGVDLIFTNAGQPPVSVTIAGYSSADLANGRLTQTWGRTPDLPGLPGSEFLTLHGN